MLFLCLFGFVNAGVFEEMYKFYRMYRGIKVDRYIRSKLRDLERKYPYNVDRRWIREKALDL